MRFLHRLAVRVIGVVMHGDVMIDQPHAIPDDLAHVASGRRPEDRGTNSWRLGSGGETCTRLFRLMRPARNYLRLPRCTWNFPLTLHQQPNCFASGCTCRSATRSKCAPAVALSGNLFDACVSRLAAAQPRLFCGGIQPRVAVARILTGPGQSSTNSSRAAEHLSSSSSFMHHHVALLQQ